jgi:hypothetical protein
MHPHNFIELDCIELDFSTQVLIGCIPLSRLHDKYLAGRQDFGLRREFSRTLELRRSAKLSRVVETLPALRKSINLHRWDASYCSQVFNSKYSHPIATLSI